MDNYEFKRTRKQAKGGYLDDLILLPALAALTVSFLPKDVYAENRRKAEGGGYFTLILELISIKAVDNKYPRCYFRLRRC